MRTDCVNFHGTDVKPTPPEQAMFHVIPVPYEKTTCYGKGTAGGPRAILEASHQLELFDGYDVPAEHGIYTHPEIPCDGRAEEVLESIAACTEGAARLGKIPVLLGGEHTVTVGAVRGLQQAGCEFGVVQFDAHADLRALYEGKELSHACTARRIVDLRIPVAQIGVRALSLAEHEFRAEERIPHLDAAQIAAGATAEGLLPEDFPGELYITFDIDALDPGIVPSTGTPEPGGLTWFQAVDLIKAVSRGRRIIGFDIVELAPMEGFFSFDFTAATQVYTLMGLATRKTA